ncbi:hypothetical protein KAJ87_01450 [Candidatus Pacearchaeota archaeon]|nr:hypothetical protein [Candidatus Pacearchaeota archaeon]
MKTLKIEGYEQISESQYNDLPENERLKTLKDNETEIYYFRETGKLEEDLMDFENEKMAIKIHGDGLKIINKTKKDLFLGYKNNFGFLVKAIEKAKVFAEKYQKGLREKLK